MTELSMCLSIIQRNQKCLSDLERIRLQDMNSILSRNEIILQQAVNKEKIHSSSSLQIQCTGF